MNLTERLGELISACFTGIWIESHEHQDAIVEIAQLCRDEGWSFANWDIEQGMTLSGGETSSEAGDPLAAVRSLKALASDDGTAVLVMNNLHRFIGSTEVMQAVQRQLVAGKQNRTILIVLSPVVSIPAELELFVVVEHEMPSRDQLLEIARGIATEETELPTGSELDLVLDAAGGLTRAEAESAFSLSLVRHGRIQPDAIWELKSQMLKKSGLLEMYRGDADFGSLGGLSALKSFYRRALSRSSENVKPRGVMLPSPPGCGKSQFCKALGRETGRPVIILDVGSLMGSLVGQTEQRTRQALRIIDAMAPAIVMLDEIDKAFAGVGGSGQSDSGVSARMFGSFLSWLNDRESDTFVVCTANDVGKLPPEFARAERFDSIFFVDLPSREEKNLIWEQYISVYGLAADQTKPKDDVWTGAEIKAACRLAALLDIPIKAAAQNVVPVAVTSSESIERLRAWARGRCIDAHNGGLYELEFKKGKTKSRRKIKVDPSLN
ncbi:AAA family ATPase [Mariniblastus fucicola]|uniref:Uncharacterized AAA domain-containing protein ycf46 n=1 Tax=Mariniblastus fucicola TaxID=980251 RepID=A0A5B9PGR8_9BACT|nr:AAA family ATPase [Mariniblastus fucicola]QEG24799.1 ATP-dependent zinc metalloprotease FtsH 3 [Mariniblastus fucicola]